MNIQKPLATFHNVNNKQIEINQSTDFLSVQGQSEITEIGKKQLLRRNSPDICIISFTQNNFKLTRLFLEKGNKSVTYKPFEIMDKVNSKNFNYQRVVKAGKNVYRGGKPINEEAIKELKDLGIDTIICFLKKDRSYYQQINNWKEEKTIAKKYGINLIHLPMDEYKGPSPKYIKKFLKLYKQRHKHPIYFHCFAGQDRAGIMGAIADIEIFNMTFDQAYARMLSQNHDINRFSNLDAYLYKYCLDKGEKPENMHPREILEQFIDKNTKFVSYPARNKELLINDVIQEMELLAKPKYN